MKRKPGSKHKKLKLTVPAEFKAHHKTEIKAEKKSLTIVIGGADKHFVKTTWPEHLRALGSGKVRRPRTDAACDDWGK